MSIDEKAFRKSVEVYTKENEMGRNTCNPKALKKALETYEAAKASEQPVSGCPINAESLQRHQDIFDLGRKHEGAKASEQMTVEQMLVPTINSNYKSIDETLGCCIVCAAKGKCCPHGRQAIPNAPSNHQPVDCREAFVKWCTDKVSAYPDDKEMSFEIMALPLMEEAWNAAIAHKREQPVELSASEAAKAIIESIWNVWYGKHKGQMHSDEMAKVLNGAKQAISNAIANAKNHGEMHCVDCCCARAWKALGISQYTGKSIAEHITELREPTMRESIEPKITVERKVLNLPKTLFNEAAKGQYAHLFAMTDLGNMIFSALERVGCKPLFRAYQANGFDDIEIDVAVTTQIEGGEA